MSAAARRRSAATATLTQVKALADPLRYRVFEHLLAEPHTAKQMAALLGTHPTRLYHHFRVLEDAGLIRLVATRQKRGTTERYFKASVTRIEARSKGGMSSAAASALLEGVLGSTLADIQRVRGRRRGGRPASEPYLKRYRIHATPLQAAEIRAHLDALAEVCERASVPAGTPEFGVTLAFYETPGTVKRRRTP